MPAITGLVEAIPDPGVVQGIGINGTAVLNDDLPNQNLGCHVLLHLQSLGSIPSVFGCHTVSLRSFKILSTVTQGNDEADGLSLGLGEAILPGIQRLLVCIGDSGRIHAGEDAVGRCAIDLQIAGILESSVTISGGTVQIRLRTVRKSPVHIDRGVGHKHMVKPFGQGVLGKQADSAVIQIQRSDWNLRRFRFSGICG